MKDLVRDLTVEAAQVVGLSKSLGSGSSLKSVPFAKLKALLDSRSDRDILDGLRRVIAMIYLNKPCLPYFSSVVKNVANTNIEVKKLVYIYLLHYAESDPDLALLSVNAIQKSLTDQNPQVRAMALRTMAGMRVPVISQIVSLAIKRGVVDMSPHVRKAAALAIPKCYRLDPNALPQLLEYLSTLLADKQYFVVGPAVQAFIEICPERIDLIHRHYRSLVKKLVDMDEWGQLATLKLLQFYSRKCFPRRKQKISRMTKKDFYDDGVAESEEPDIEVDVLDPDLDLLLKACEKLLQSRNPAIVVAVTSCYFYLGTKMDLQKAIGPLIALLRGPPETQQVILPNIVSIALRHPQVLVPYTAHFLMSSRDVTQIWRMKVELLTLVFPHAALHLKSLILSELDYFAHSSDVTQVQECVRAIGRCAQNDPKTSSRCFKVLLNQISSFDNALVSEVLTVIRHLVQRDPQSHRKTITRLARNLDRTTSPEARATIIWLVGEFAGIDPHNNIAPDVLRILTKNFADESEVAKHQIVLLATKVYLQHLQSQADDLPLTTAGGEANGEVIKTNPENVDHPVAKIWSYILLLIRYDTSFDLRDRARMFRALLANPSSTQLASLLVLAPKPVPHTPSPSENRQDFVLGSSTLILGKNVVGLHGLPGYKGIPDVVEAGHEPDSGLRDQDNGAKEDYVTLANKVTNTAASQRLDEAIREQGLEKIVKGSSAKGKTLDDWLEESGSEDTETEEETEAETDEESADEGSSSAGEGTTDEEEDDDNDDGDDLSEAEGQKSALLSTH